jgi:hypothetical protein
MTNELMPMASEMIRCDRCERRLMCVNFATHHHYYEISLCRGCLLAAIDTLDAAIFIQVQNPGDDAVWLTAEAHGEPGADGSIVATVEGYAASNTFRAGTWRRDSSKDEP